MHEVDWVQFVTVFAFYLVCVGGQFLPWNEVKRYLCFYEEFDEQTALVQVRKYDGLSPWLDVFTVLTHPLFQFLQNLIYRVSTRPQEQIIADIGVTENVDHSQSGFLFSLLLLRLNR